MFKNSIKYESGNTDTVYQLAGFIENNRLKGQFRMSVILNELS